MFTFAGQIFQLLARPSNVNNYGFNFTLRHPLSLWPMEGAKWLKIILLKIWSLGRSVLDEVVLGQSRNKSIISRAQPDWTYEFPDQTGPDTQICRTGPAGPDWIQTESGLKFLTFYLTTSMGYQLSYDKVLGHKFGVKKSKLGCIWKKKKKKILKFFKKFFLIFSSIFKSAKSPASGRKNILFPDSPDSEICRTSGPDVMSGRALIIRTEMCLGPKYAWGQSGLGAKLGVSHLIVEGCFSKLRIASRIDVSVDLWWWILVVDMFFFIRLVLWDKNNNF